MENQSPPARDPGGTVMKPSVGRIVHLRQGDATLAAVVSKVWSDTTVNLAFFTEDGSCSPRTSVIFGTEDGRWSWPPRA